MIMHFNKNKWMRIAIQLLIVLLVVAMGVWGMADVFTGYRAQDLVTVGKVKVSGEAYRNDLNQELSRIAQQTGSLVTLEDAKRIGLDQAVFDRMVNTAVVDDRTISLGLAIGHDALVSEVMASPSFKNADGTFGRERFNNILMQNGLNEESFLASETGNRLRQTVNDLPASGIVVPRVVTEALLRYRQETRDARYFTITASESDVAQPTEDEVSKQYSVAPAAYTAPEFRSVAMITLQPIDVAAKLVVTEEEIAAEYERTKKDYYTPEKRTVLQLSLQDKAKAEEAKKKIDGGADFVAVAAEYGKQQADITFADRAKTEFLDAKVADAVFGLAAGTVSDLVEGDLAVSLIKVVKIAPEVQQTLEQVREAVTQRVKDDRAEDEIQAVYEAVEEARGEATAFEDIAAKAGIPFRMIAAVDASGRDKAGKSIEPPLPSSVLKRAFASDVGIQEDAIGEGQGFVWYEVREIIPSALRPLAEVKEKVVADVKADKLRGIVEKKAKEMIAGAGTTTKLDTLAAQSNGQVKTVTGIRRIDVTEEFDGLATLAVFAAKANTMTYAVDADGRSAKIIEVTKVTTPALSTASADMKEVADAARQGLGDDLQQAYLKAARQTADFSINEELWRTIQGGSAATP